jgi:glycerol-1-phosphate dehydrogenase [NAD(P)+]
VQSIVLEPGVHPDGDAVDRVRRATQAADALIAVGSGSINDICKYAGAQNSKPYAVFATAPSMNGYTSFNAAITLHGHKLSLPAQVPRGAFFDLEILAAAPLRLIRAGLGDSLCRTTAEAAGFGTAIVGHSQPASQGEHLISHYLDMFAPASRPLVYHGEQVGVTTLTMARLQQRMLATRPRVTPDTATRAEFESKYGAELGASCWTEFDKKRLTRDGAERLNDLLGSRWSEIRDRIGSILLNPERLMAVLNAAGADITPEAIHLDRGFYEKAVLHSREIRDRYTFLDLAADAGVLRQSVGEL